LSKQGGPEHAARDQPQMTRPGAARGYQFLAARPTPGRSIMFGTQRVSLGLPETKLTVLSAEPT